MKACLAAISMGEMVLFLGTRPCQVTDARFVLSAIIRLRYLSPTDAALLQL